MSEPQMIKIRIPLDIPGGPAGENVWAELVSDNQAKIQNTPIFASHVGYDDIVEFTQVAGRPEFVRVVTPSGRRTVLVTYEYKADTIQADFRKIQEGLQAAGITGEGYQAGLMGLSVPPAITEESLKNTLALLGLTEVPTEDDSTDAAN